MSQATRSRLLADYAADLQLLTQVIGVDVLAREADFKGTVVDPD